MKSNKGGKRNGAGRKPCTDLEWSLYKQVVELKEKVKKLEFMIENGLGWEDMRNDISMPHEL